ncbi:MAG: cyclic nucleotide-binding domain-containing protein [Nitrospirae bacterium]|nr:cyclic nucleotide-binding domain-containing protein [Nitrospirota bacterium]
MNITPFGQYLLRELPEARHYLQKALDIQSALIKKGEHRYIGVIMAENGWISERILQRCLLRQREDCLRDIALFEPVPVSSLLAIASQSLHLALPEDAVIFRQHDRGDSYFIIVSGSVALSRTCESGREIPTTVLGPGEGFGELALLTGADRASTATTKERTVLISVPKPVFDSMLAANPSVMRGFVRVLAERLMKGSDRIADAKAVEDAYRAFISEQNSRHTPIILGSTAVIRKALDEIDKAAGEDGHVLVQGEAGTELWDAAALIHRTDGNLFTYDAGASVGFSDQGSYEKGLSLEMIQISALFGRSKESLPSRTGRRIGLFQLADNGAVIVENIDLLSAAAQSMLADYLLSGAFCAFGDATPLRARVRVLATTHADIEMLAAQGMFSQQLLDLIGTTRIMLPPLRLRKKDIRETVEHYIHRYNRQLGLTIDGLDEDAYKAIMAYDWPGNHDELASAVRRAMSICQDCMLSSGHIFLSPPPVSGQIAFDLFSYDKIKNLFLNKKFPVALQVAALPGIALIILLGFFGSQDPNRNLALVLTWAFWEPAVVLGSFFLARSWCSTCPMGPTGYLIGRSFGLKIKVPQIIRTYGIYLTAVGIASIFWAESVFDMPHSPKATAILVLTVALSALIVGYIFERRTWCRYLCPLGGLVGFLSRCSAVELRSNYNICNTNCLNHDCYVGNEKGEGCPLFEGPFSLHSNQNCVLCGNCVKICPNNSPVFNLRVPGQELWASANLEMSGVIIGSALIGTQIFRGLEQVGLFHALRSAPLWWLYAALLIVGMTGGAVLFAAATGRRYFPVSENSQRATAYGIYCLIPLSVAFEVNFHLTRVLTMGGTLLQVLGKQIGVEASLPSFAASSVTIKMLQIVILLAGSAISMKVAHRFSISFSDNRAAYRPVLLFALFYLILFLAV